MSKRKVLPNYENVSRGATQGVSYRKVINLIVKFAENEVLQLHPDKSYIERIKMAQEEPFWTAAKELRDLTDEEKKQVGLTKD